MNAELLGLLGQLVFPLIALYTLGATQREAALAERFQTQLAHLRRLPLCAQAVPVLEARLRAHTKSRAPRLRRLKRLTLISPLLFGLPLGLLSLLLH